MHDTEWIFSVLEILGTAAFSVSGAMVAVGKRMDLFGIVFLGMTTAFGGGTLRDMMAGQVPKMFTNFPCLWVALLMALAVFLAARIRQNTYAEQMNRILTVNNIIDAVGLGAFTVTGINIAYQYGLGENPVLAVSFGVITGIGGGMLRDVFVREIPSVFTKHIYAVASIAGGILYECLLQTTLPPALSMAIGVLTVFGIRICATVGKWNLPKALP